MNVKNFISEINSLAPSKEVMLENNHDVVEMDEDLAEDIVKDFIINKNTNIKEYKNSLDDLIINTDISTKTVGHINFFSSIRNIDEKFNVFAVLHDSYLIAQKNSNNKIIIIDSDTYEQEYTCANNFNTFLEYLVIYQSIFIQIIINNKSINDCDLTPLKKILISKYSDFYVFLFSSFLSIELLNNLSK